MMTCPTAHFTTTTRGGPPHRRGVSGALGGIRMIAFAFALCGSAAAQDARDAVDTPDEEPPTFRLTIYRASAPHAALSLRLLPGYLERKPGNAAVLYNRLANRIPQGDARRSKTDRFVGWSRTPLEELPLDKIRSELGEQRELLADLRQASRHEFCRWELADRPGDYFSIPLPEVDAAIYSNRLLSLQARLQIAEGRFDDAIDTLKTGIALARHIGHHPTMVGALVGTANLRSMTGVVSEFVRQPNAPNLYWALTSLPTPLIDVRIAAEAEPHALEISFPELRELDDDNRTAEYWNDVLDRLIGWIQNLNDDPDSHEETRFAIALNAVKRFPSVKQTLIDSGRSQREVDSMPTSRVILLAALRSYRRRRDDLYKQLLVPIGQANSGEVSSLNSEIGDVDADDILLTSTTFPAVDAYHLAATKCDREVAIFRIVEALRLHAENRGKLASSLAEITEVPIPLDPVTGGPFVYRIEDGFAMLEAPLPVKMTKREHGYRLWIDLAP